MMRTAPEGRRPRYGERNFAKRNYTNEPKLIEEIQAL